MKANEFVKKYGWDAIKHDLSGYFKDEKIGTIQVLTHEREYIEVNGDDLKRLVEAHEIIKLFKSLDRAKTEAQACEYSKHSEILVKLDVGVGYIWLSRVKQAIADVESCQ